MIISHYSGFFFSLIYFLFFNYKGSPLTCRFYRCFKENSSHAAMMF